MSVNTKMTIRKFAAMLLALTVLLSSMAPAYAELAYTNTKATIYVEESGKLKKAGTAAKGTAVSILDTNGDWALVEKDGKQAYMKLSELAAEEAEQTGSSGKVTKCQKTVYVAVEGAKVYEADDAASTELTTMAKGAKLTMTAYSDNWCLIKSGSTVGFMKRSELSLEKVSAEEKTETSVVTNCKKTVYVAVDSAKVYANVSESSEQLDTLSKGTKLTMVSYNDEWCKVKAGSKSGFMKRSELSLEKVEADIVEEDDSETVTKCKKTVYVAVDSAKVYKSASELSNVQDTLTMGQKLTMTAYTDTWCLVKSGSNSGYMKRSELSLEKVEAPATDDGVTKCDKNGYAVEDGVKVYKKADTGSKVLTTLSKNQAVNVVAYTSEWCQVKNGKNIGYVQLSKLSDSEIVDLPTELKYGDKGDAVKMLQQRLKDLGYFSGTIGGNYLDQTRSAVMLFQAQHDLSIDGTAGEKTLSKLFSDKAEKYDPSKVDTSNTVTDNSGTSTASPAAGKSIEMDWWTSGIQSIFSRGTTAVVTDVSTGISWKEKRTGGTNHADVQPVTAADTAAMKKACGSWSWERRAVWVSIGGQKYAASMNCMPHGSGSITTNNFDGHHCIHFTNSRTHGTNSVCPLHQAAIKKALAKG